MYPQQNHKCSMIATLLLFWLAFAFSLPLMADEFNDGTLKSIRISPDRSEISLSTQNYEKSRDSKNIGYGLLIDRSGSMLTWDAEDADLPGVYHQRFEAAIEEAEKDFLYFYDLWYNVHHQDAAYSYYVSVMHFGDDIVPPPPGEPALAPVGLWQINCAYWRILCSIDDAADPYCDSVYEHTGIYGLPGPYSGTTTTPLVQGIAEATDILESYRDLGFYNLKYLYIYTDGRENTSEHYFGQAPWDACDRCLDDGPIWPDNWRYDCDPDDPLDPCKPSFKNTATCFDYQCCMAAQISNNLDEIHLEYIPEHPKGGAGYTDPDIESESNPSVLRDEYANQTGDTKSPANRSGEDYEWLRNLTESTGGTVQVITKMPSWPTLIIEKVHDALQGHFVELAIYIEHMDFQMGGFDLLLGYDASAITFVEAKAGQLLSDCAWEHFTYRFGASGNCGNACPSGMIRLVGLAETNDGPNHPSCFAPPDTALHELARLKFYVTNDRTYECQYVPVRFFWSDCGDNTVSSIGGEILYVDRIVFDFDYTTVWNEKYDSLFPEDTRIPFVGAPDYCLSGDTGDCSTSKPPVIRLFNFVNGGIDIICSDSIDLRGDINCDGVAWTIADAVSFVRCLMNPATCSEAAIAASDCNADGIPFSIADLVYLIRVIVGDAPPYPKTIPQGGEVAVNLQVNHSAAAVAVNSTVDIGGGYFELDHTGYDIGEPHLINGASDMTLKYGDDNGVLRVLVYSMEKDKRIPAGTEHIFAVPISGEGMIALSDVELSDYFGNLLTTRIDTKPVLPAKYAVHQNFPNPFNATTTIMYELPVATHVKLDVFNTLGQRVTTLIDRDETAGIHSVTWDGTDQSGVTVASGVYIYRISTAEFTAEKKMILMK